MVSVNDADRAADAEAERLDAAADDDSDDEELSAPGQSERGSRRGAAVRRELERRMPPWHVRVRRPPVPPSGCKNISHSAASARAAPSKNGFARSATVRQWPHRRARRKGPHTDDIRLDGRAIRTRAAAAAQVFIFNRSPGDPLREAEGDRAALIDRLPKTAGRRFVAVSPMPGIDGGLEIVTSDGALAAKLQRAVHGCRASSACA